MFALLKFIWFAPQVLCAVSYFAQGNYQRYLGRGSELSMSQSSVCRGIHEVTQALNHPDVLTRFIHFPVTPEEREATIQR